MQPRNACSTHAFSVPLHVHCLVCFAWQTLKISLPVRPVPQLNIEFRSVDLHLEKIRWMWNDHSYNFCNSDHQITIKYSTGFEIGILPVFQDLWKYLNYRKSGFSRPFKKKSWKSGLCREIPAFKIFRHSEILGNPDFVYEFQFSRLSEIPDFRDILIL